MNLNNIIKRYKQFGGLKLIWQYKKLGVLPAILKAGIRCLKDKKSFKVIYPVVQKGIEPFLIEKYKPILYKSKTFYSKITLVHNKSNIVWFCWLQGFIQAPDIVKSCYVSLKKNLLDRNIRFIDDNNWKHFVELPDYIIKKWKKKQIPAALFSDLLRLQLLIKYGGTWIDSTVLCTGKENTNDYFDTELFLFQYGQQGAGGDIIISNWFITAHSNNEILMSLRDMLFAYWKDYSCTLDYYIFHLFFPIVAKEYPNQIAAIPYGYSMNSLILLHHWGEKFEQNKWDNLISRVSFHKLACRVNDKIIKDRGNYFNYILNTFSIEYLNNEDI